jgi:uncharacterized protein
MIFTEKDKRIFSKMKAAILSVDETAEIILFGSRARGDFRENSDYDFLILTNNEVNYTLRKKIHNRLYDLDVNENVVLQGIVRNKKEWNNLYTVTSFFDNIKTDGFKIC